MKVVIGISGGIAAYKVPQLVRLFVKAGHEVKCAATEHALEFVTPLTLETVSQNKLYCDLFAKVNEHSTEHISLKDWGDVLVVAPATANIIGKLASGIGDDALSTLMLSFSQKPIYICPAMNTQMGECESVRRNIETLRKQGVRIIESTSGELACGTVGNGRMEEPEAIFERVEGDCAPMRRQLRGKRVLITAGPTYERIDAVRFIGNYSSGKMGFALANEFAERGAEVTLIAGPTALKIEHPLVKRIDIESAREMYAAATAAWETSDIAVLSAAVADFRPESVSDMKIKKQGDGGMDLHLVQNPDILATLGANKTERQVLVGFALETNDEIAHAHEKLERKNLDLIVMNSLRDKGAGFGTDTNKVTIIDRDGRQTEGSLKSKADVARDIADCATRLSAERSEKEEK